MLRWLGFIFRSLLWLLGSSLAIIALLMYFGVKVDLGFLRGGVEVAASSALNRSVSIEGPVELEFSSQPALNVAGIKIANLPDGVAVELLSAGSARLQIALLPLLKAEIRVVDISAADIRLNLESLEGARSNWVFDVPGEASKAKLPGDTQQDKNSIGSLVRLVALDNISLRNIEVNYYDAGLGKSWPFVLDELQASAMQTQPISLVLNGRANRKPYALTVEGEPLSVLFDHERVWGFSANGSISGKQVAGSGGFRLRAEQPVLNLSLQAGELDVGLILSSLGLVEGLQATLGDAALDMELKGNSLQTILSQSSMRFDVSDASWLISVPNTESQFIVENLQGTIAVEQGNNLVMLLDGAIQDVPLKLRITGAPLVQYVLDQQQVPLKIEAELLQSRVVFGINVVLPLASPNIALSLKLESDRIDRLEALFDLDLPPLGPVALESQLKISPQGFDLSKMQLQVGESTLTGRMNLDTSMSKPELEVEVVSELIQLDDFLSEREQKRSATEGDLADEADSESAAEAANAEKGREKKKLLSYEALSTFNADIKVEAKQVLSGEDPLGSTLLQIKLEETRLSIAPLSVELPGGGIEINMDYTPGPDAMEFNARAKIDEFDIGAIMHRLKPGTDMGGNLWMDMDISSRAPDFASLMKTASGQIDFGLVPKNFSSGVVDLWAVNLLSSVMDKSTEKDQSTVNCVVIRLDVEDGVMQADALYLDTSKMRIVGKVDIDFKTRDLLIRLAPKAKRPEFFSVAIPIQVKGSLDDFGLKIGILRMASQVISSITSPVHVPIRRVFTEDAPEDGVQACREAWTRTAEKAPQQAAPEPNY